MATLEDPQITSHDAQPTAVVRGRVRMDELGGFYDRAYGQVAEALGRQGTHPAGAAFGYYLTRPAEVVELEAGFPTTAAVAEEGDVVASELPAGEVARGTHVGGYEGLGESWGALARWIGEQGRAPGARMWEVYVTEPSPEADPATLRTDLYWTLAD
jgi:effector-binding domain-containing protein